MISLGKKRRRSNVLGVMSERAVLMKIRLFY